MKSKKANKQTPPKTQNLKLKEKSEVFSDITHASQRSYKFQAASMIKHLNLDIFKLNPCNITKTHNHKHCMNYHNAKDRKRYGDHYSRNLCPYIEAEQKCPNGDACLDAHSRVEQLYRYDSYKKWFCSHFPNSIEACPYGDYCSFAHSEEEIQANLIHNFEEDQDFYMFYYKTVFCPFNLTEHDKSQCVYAHNWQDYRRSPNVYPHYEPIACYNWKMKNFITDYNSGCDNGPDCNMCHGWKEQQYHPSYYRTVKCEEYECRKGSCPNYHSEKERRIVQPEIINKCFKYVPKNRIVQGVFKVNSKKEGFKMKPEYKAKTVVNPRSQNHSEENDYKTRTIISQKGRKSEMEVENIEKIYYEKEEEKIEKIFHEKENIDSDEEGDDLNGNEIVSSQLSRLGLGE